MNDVDHIMACESPSRTMVLDVVASPRTQSGPRAMSSSWAMHVAGIEGSRSGEECSDENDGTRIRGARSAPAAAATSERTVPSEAVDGPGGRPDEPGRGLAQISTEHSATDAATSTAPSATLRPGRRARPTEWRMGFSTNR